MLSSLLQENAPLLALGAFFAFLFQQLTQKTRGQKQTMMHQHIVDNQGSEWSSSLRFFCKVKQAIFSSLPPESGTTTESLFTQCDGQCEIEDNRERKGDNRERKGDNRERKGDSDSVESKSESESEESESEESESENESSESLVHDKDSVSDNDSVNESVSKSDRNSNSDNDHDNDSNSDSDRTINLATASPILIDPDLRKKMIAKAKKATLAHVEHGGLTEEIRRQEIEDAEKRGRPLTGENLKFFQMADKEWFEYLAVKHADFIAGYERRVAIRKKYANKNNKRNRSSCATKVAIKWDRQGTTDVVAITTDDATDNVRVHRQKTCRTKTGQDEEVHWVKAKYDPHTKQRMMEGGSRVVARRVK